jgi:hypothetical protein
MLLGHCVAWRRIEHSAIWRLASRALHLNVGCAVKLPGLGVLRCIAGCRAGCRTQIDRKKFPKCSHGSGVLGLACGEKDCWWMVDDGRCAWSSRCELPQVVFTSSDPHQLSAMDHRLFASLEFCKLCYSEVILRGNIWPLAAVPPGLDRV